MRQYGKSRRELFMELEKHRLASLPQTRFSIGYWSKVKVHIDYRLKKVQIRTTRSRTSISCKCGSDYDTSKNAGCNESPVCLTFDRVKTTVKDQ